MAGVLAHFKKLPKYQQAPFAFMTAKVQDESIQLYKEMGACAIIPEPFNSMEFGNQIEKIWEDFHLLSMNSFTNRFDQVRSDYLNRLNFIMQDITQHLVAMNESSYSFNDFEALKVIVNILMGLGQSYGFEDIPSEAKILLQRLDEIQHDDSGLQLSDYDQSRISALTLITVLEQNLRIANIRSS